jgi:ribulose-phosphate 3-epimerase
MIGERPIHLEVDGGITVETAATVAAAGADVLVAGSAVFKGKQGADYGGNIADIRASAAAAI